MFMDALSSRQKEIIINYLLMSQGKIIDQTFTAFSDEISEIITILKSKES